MSSSASLAAPVPAPSRGLRIALWTVQFLLAAAFGLGALMKLFQPMEALATAMAWTRAVPEAVVRVNAAAELAGALGLVLPSLTRIQPRLTVLAAVGLVTVMVLAIGFHLSRGEVAETLPPLVLGALAAFVAWGRARKAPITPRGR